MIYNKVGNYNKLNNIAVDECCCCCSKCNYFINTQLKKKESDCAVCLKQQDKESTNGSFINSTFISFVATSHQWSKQTRFK